MGLVGVGMICALTQEQGDGEIAVVDIDRRNSNLTVLQATAAASGGEWGIPEFQRDFVWPPQRVVLLTRTLLFGWSMSCWHNWQPRRNKEDIRHRTKRVDLDQAEKWVLDGQQRLTSVAIMTGRRPSWYAAPAWARLLASHAPSLDLRALEKGRLVVGQPQVPATQWLPFPSLFTSPKVLQADLTDRGFPDLFAQAADVAARIDGYQIPIVTLHNTPSSAVVEQFRLLNQQATRVPPSIIKQGVLSVLVPGFTVDFAEPLRVDVGLAGWPVKQTTIIDSFLDTAGVKRVEAVDPDEVPLLQKRCAQAWRDTVAYLAAHGVHGLSCWPAERMLRGLVIAADGWPEALEDHRLAAWVMCACWDGHQADSDQLVQDIATIQMGRKNDTSWNAVIAELCSRLETSPRAVKASDLTNAKTSPEASKTGARERMLLAATFPNPPEIAKAAKVPVWAPLNEIPGGLADWALTLGTTRSSQPTTDFFSKADRAKQAIVSPHSTSTRAKALAVAMNATLDKLGSQARPKSRVR
jgi:Protein of unknown function DUF262